MNKNKIILSISFSIVLVICLVIGATYAYWSRTIVSENNLVLSGCFNITFTNESNDISLNRAYPITDEEASNLTPYSFRVTNSCNVKAKYNINLETLTGSTLDTNLLNVSLSSDTPKRLGSLDAASTQLDNGVSSNTLVEGILKPGKSIDYNLRVWLPYDITNEQGQNESWNGKVVLNAVGTDEVMLADLMKHDDFTSVVGYGNATYSSFEVTDTIPDNYQLLGDVSASYSNYPIYLYINSDRDVRLYTEAEKISFNENSSEMFVNAMGIHVSSLDLSKFDFSKVVDASYMFYDSSVEELDFSGQDMSNIEDMSYMFNGTKTKTINLTNVDLSNVKNMSHTFYDTKLEKLYGLDTVKIDKVENIHSCFADSTNLEISLDLSNWNTENLTTADYAFYSTGLKNLNLDGWYLKGFTHLTFYDSNKLLTLSLRNAHFYNESQIEKCGALISIDVTGSDFSNVTQLSHYFERLPNLTEIIGIANIDTSHVTKMYAVFYSLEALDEIDLSGWDTSSIQDSSVSNFSLFYSCNLNRLILDNFDFRNSCFINALGYPSNVKYLSLKNAIDGSTQYLPSSISSSVEVIDLTGYDISRRNSLAYMFCSMSNLKRIIGIEDLDVSNISDFQNIFWGCKSLEELNISSWNMSNATNFSLMFASANLDIGISFMQNWNVSSVTNFDSMFAGATNLIDITPLNNWNVSNTATFNNMFKDVTLDSYPTWDGTWDTTTGTFTPNNA